MALEEIAWAAGFFEGEGTVLLSGDYLHVRIGNTDEEILRRFAGVIDVGTVYGPYEPYGSDEHRRKRLWVWLAREEAGLDALALMWPWLGTRRRNRAVELSGVRFHVFSQVSRELLAQRERPRDQSPADAA